MFLPIFKSNTFAETRHFEEGQVRMLGPVVQKIGINKSDLQRSLRVYNLLGLKPFIILNIMKHELLLSNLQSY